MNGRNYGEPDFKYVWDKIKTGSVDITALRGEINQIVQQAISGLTPQVGGDYNALTNKPSIKGVTLTGDKDYEDLKLYVLDDGEDEDPVALESLSNLDIEGLINSFV